MHKIRFVLVISLLLSLILIMPAFSEEVRDSREPKAQPEQKKIKHIVLVTIDGLNNQKMLAAYTPNLNTIAATGIKTSAVGVLPANFATFFSSLLAGAEPSIHGFTGAGGKVKTRLLPDIVHSYGRTAAYVANSEFMLKDLFKESSKGVRLYKVNGDNTSVINKALAVYHRDQPYFLAVRLAVDAKDGKQAKISSLKTINDIDLQIGRLLEALQSDESAGESLIVVAGFSPTSLEPSKTAGNADAAMLPVIMAGPGFKIGMVLPPIKIIDIMPTLCLLTGLQNAPESNGMILWNGLQAGAGFVEQNLLLKRIKDLSEENSANIKVIYRFTEEQRKIKLEKENNLIERVKIKKTVETKDQRISSLQTQIKALKLIGMIITIVMGSGYIFEYFYLRKKFLIF